MSEDQSNKEEQFDFTPEGETLGYIGLDQARIQAIEHARDNTGFYGPAYAGVRLVWEVVSAQESDDYYDIRLSFRPSGRYRGDPGVEQLIFDKTGDLRVRQMLDEPTELGETVASAASGPAVAAASPDEPTSRPTPTTSPIVTPTPTPNAKPSPVADLSAPITFEFLFQWGSQGSGDGQFKLPAGIAVDAAGKVYVTELANNRVQVFDASGELLHKWGSEGRGIGPFRKRSGDGQFNWPKAIAVDPAGNVYVGDTYNDRVQVFDASGELLHKWGNEGRGIGPFRKRSGDGQFNWPKAIAVDPAGNVYVGDTYNDRVQVFDSNGRFLRKWGTVGSGDGLFDGPNGIAVDRGGNVYVTELQNDRVQVFDSNGRFLVKWGTEGRGDGQFKDPNGIAVDGTGNVYVADEGNHRVQVFAPVR